MSERVKHFAALAALVALLVFLVITGSVWVAQMVPPPEPEMGPMVVRDYAPPLGQSPWRRSLAEPRAVSVPTAQLPWRYRPSRGQPVNVAPAQ